MPIKNGRRAAILVPLILIGLSPLLSADKEPVDLFHLNMEDLLNVRVISTSRRAQRSLQSPRAVSVVTAEEIRRRNYRSVPDALSSLVGVTVQYTNYGGGAPIIRGLIGNRILILVDGVRINNAIYRLGPNQYLNTIDINRVEQIEVVRGPGSVLYGSDALGGLVNIITRKAKRGDGSPELSPSLHVRAASADRSVSTRAQINGGHGKLGFTGGVSLKQFGDLRAGRAVGRQLNTGYDEAAGDLKLSYALADDRAFTFSIERLQQEDVRRTDLLRAGSDLRYEWDPQAREMLVAQYSHGRVGPFVESLQLGFTLQRHRENINRITATRPGSLRMFDDRVSTAGLFLQASSRWGDRQVFTYGVEHYQDRVRSQRNDLDLLKGTLTPGKGTFADGSQFHSTAFYVQDEIQVTPDLSLSLKGRHSRFETSASSVDSVAGTVSIDSHPGTVTTGLYAAQRIAPGLFLVGGVGQGFRAPNVDDTTILGSFAGGFEVPNPALRPEKATNYEVGLKVQNNWFTGTASIFNSRFSDLMDRAPGTYRGFTFLDLNGNGVKDRGEDDVYQRQNIGRARIRGVELEGQLRLSADWSAWANTSWLHGVDLTQRTPMTRIPPVKGEAGLRWLARRNVWVEPWFAYAGHQTRLSPADRVDRRIAPGGTPGFAVAGIRASLELRELGVLSLGFENLGDKAYRYHGSGIDSPGRGLVFGLGRSF